MKVDLRELEKLAVHLQPDIAGEELLALIRAARAAKATQLPSYSAKMWDERYSELVAALSDIEDTKE